MDKIRLRHFAIITAAIAGGFIGIFMRLIGDSVPALSVTFFRSFIGFIFLLAFVPIIDGKVFDFNAQDMKGYIMLGFLSAVTILPFITAFSYAPISNVVLLNGSYVIFTTIIAHHFLKEKITKKELEAMGLGLLGLIIINPFEAHHMLGNILAILSGLGFAIFLSYLRHQGRSHSVGTSLWILLFGSIFLFPIMLVKGVGNIEVAWLWLVLMGILSTGIVTLLLTYGMQKVKAEDASILLVTIGPLSAIILSYLLLNEPLQTRVLLGGALLLFAGIILEYDKKKKKVKKHLSHV